MKKFTCLLLLGLCVSGCVYAAEDGSDYVGFLARLKTTPEEFFMLMKRSWAVQGWIIEGGDHSTSEAKFYDSLMIMQLALNRGEIDEMILPDFVAEYLFRAGNAYEPSCVSSSGIMNLCFGFMNSNRALRDKWNAALTSMRNDFTLAGLEQKYIRNFSGDFKHDAVKFTRFNDAQTINVAVTGDLPPVDFVDEFGMSIGYSTAVLAEIGRRLRVNINLVGVSAGARTAALVSGRADVVFWYEVNKSLSSQPDVPDEIILSEPYFAWDKFIHVRSSED